jgi:hypothetical protein
MEPPQQNAPTATTLPSARLLFLFAILLPAAVAATNQLLIKSLSHEWLRMVIYPAMALSTAVLSWCTGRCLWPSWLTWIVFGWSLALLDLLTIAVVLGGPFDTHFAYLMVTAQIGLIVLWAILGPPPWQWRLPVVLVSTPGIIAFAGFSTTGHRGWISPYWTILLTISTLVVAVLCAILRYTGFSLRFAKTATADNPQSDPERVFQFGLRHMLIWSTALIPMLLVGRGIDFLMFTRIGTQGMFPLMLLAATLALISLTAIWAVLGTGAWLLRIAVLLLLPGIFAYAMHLTTEHVRSLGPVWGNSPSYMLIGMDETWTSWLYMNALLLAALLLFLRAKGYRLIRWSSRA